MVSFVVLKDPVTTFVTAFNNSYKLTNDLLIFKLIDHTQIISHYMSIMSGGNNKILGHPDPNS